MKTHLIVIAMSSILVLPACKKKDKTEEIVPTVEVADVVVDSVTLHKTYPGYIVAMNTNEITARVSGTLTGQFYHEGDYVEKGQLLFTIDPSKYRDLVEQNQAALKTAESQYAYASRQYEAMKEALKADAVSQMEVLQAESTMNQAKASIQNAKASLATAWENLGYCNIRAPRSGHISIAALSTGNFVNGEASPVLLATIYDDSTVKANFSIEDSQYEKMLGDNTPEENMLLKNIPLKFNQTLPHAYTADLNYVSPTVEKSTGTLTLEGHLSNPYGELKDGMYVSVDLPYGTDAHAILVRNASVGTDQLGKYVYLVNDSDKVVYTPVEVGEIYQDTLIMVTKGLKPGQRYVTKALLTVRNGMKVKPNVEL